MAATVWNDDEIREVCEAVTKTGEALQNFALTQGTTYVTPEDAFKSIMLFDITDTITLQIDTTGVVGPFNCRTSKPAPSQPSMGTINCGDQKPLDQYTIVHELGHTFQHRTTQIANSANPQAHPCYSPAATSQSLNNCVAVPVPGAQNNSLGSGDVEFIMGIRTRYYTRSQVTAILNRVGETEVTADDFNYDDYFAPDDPTEYCLAENDWIRGTRGWGSLAPQVGPCGGSAPSNFLPTNFQQNPCEYYWWIDAERWNVLQDDPRIEEAIVIEYEETTADMFLNWVYRTNNEGGFANIDSQGNSDMIAVSNLTTNLPGSFPMQRDGPGDDRFYWMNYQLIQFFAYYGF